jgi:thiol-disulfide isomerase/thioredoxin
MTLLSIAIALVGILCLIDLVLTLGVVRRLRDHSVRLSALSGPGFDTDNLREPGTAVDPFTATDVNGVDWSLGDLAEPTLVGFFTPDCPACEEKLPSFLAYASAFPGGRDRVFAVVAGESGGVKYRTALAEVAAVVVERERGPVQKAFGAKAFPTFLVVVDGVVTNSTHDMTDLPEHAHQPA